TTVISFQKTRSVTKPPDVRGMNKFIISEHPRIPQPVKVWSTALANVNRAKMSANNWGCWVREPHVLVGPENTLRVQNCLCNWFWVWDAWYHMLAAMGLFGAFGEWKPTYSASLLSDYNGV
ncbi:hypothetical protein PHLCEN_2v2565, partial [Hermanssonia centrifuga]